MIEKFNIEGLVLITNKPFKDDRGLFFESFNQNKFNEIIGEQITFVQDNISHSKKNVIRGLHFQKPPYTQGKLVQVLKGSVIDVAVDLRKKSPTYGQHVAVKLSAENNKMFWVPEGFAHGFSTLDEDTIFSYKCTNFYHAQSEGTLLWNDAELNIEWQVENPILSEKDLVAKKIITFTSPF